MDFNFLENCIDIPNLGEDSFHEATNSQFQYETKAALDKALQKEYGNVSYQGSKKLHAVILYSIHNTQLSIC